MSGYTFFRSPQILRIPALLQMLLRGELRIPKFQRPFVWSDRQRLELLDSIYRLMPVGSIFTWSTSTWQLACFEHLGPYTLLAPQDVRFEYVFDGHQRLTTLFATFAAGMARSQGQPLQTHLLSDELQDVRWEIYLDLEDTSFTLGKKNQAPAAHWFPLSLTFDRAGFFGFQRQLFNALGDERGELFARRAEEFVELIKDYGVPVVPIVTDDFDRVTDSFHRINSAGTTMSEVHMVNALTYTVLGTPGAQAETLSLNSKMEEVREALAVVGWQGFEARLILQVIKGIADVDIARARPREVSAALREHPELLDESREVIEEAARLLDSLVGVRGPSVIPYSYQMVLLACALSQAKRSCAQDYLDEEALRWWFWCSTFTEHFGGINPSQVKKTLTSLYELLFQGAERDVSLWSANVSPFSRFDYRAARSRGCLLQLAALAPRGPDGECYDAFELLALHAKDAVLMLVSSGEVGGHNQGPENRFIVDPRDGREFKALLSGDGSIELAWLESHGLDQELLDMYRAGDHEAFLRERRARLIALERGAVAKLGLSYVITVPHLSTCM